MGFLKLACAGDSGYLIGTYYFPGWRGGEFGASSSKPWERIWDFKERKPLLGWYDDGDVATVNTQLGWMRSYGLSYVVFDWYWGGRGVFLDQSLRAYLQAKNRVGMPFAIMWANHDQAPTSRQQFQIIIDYWIDNYLKKPEYFRVDGRPVVFIFDSPALEAKLQAFGSSSLDMLSYAQGKAKDAGMPGIYFVSSTFNEVSPSKMGYSAMSTYNYHGIERPSESYGELIRDYRRAWAFHAGRAGVRYIVPMTQGWDRRPWGGSKNPKHDLSGGSVGEFRDHLESAKAFIDAHREETGSMGIICCWNEFGEGSYIEPTEKFGFSYLEQVRAVFGSAKR